MPKIDDNLKLLAAKMRNRPELAASSIPVKKVPVKKSKGKKTYTCKDCGNEFEAWKRRDYCNICAPKHKVSLKSKNCEVCGAKFTPVRYDQKYCQNCRGHRVKSPSVGGKVKCAVCGTVFKAKNPKITKYCPECRKLDNNKKQKAGALDVKSDNRKMVKMRCQHCERVFEVTWELYRKGRKYCSNACRDEAAKKKAGKKYEPAPVEDKPIQIAEVDYSPFPAQMLIHNSKARFRVIAASNRWGKDRCSINDMLRKFTEMLSENRPSTLVPRVMGWIVAPTYKLARQNWRELKHFMPEQWVVKKNEGELQLETLYDGLIEVKSADDPESLVSVGLDFVLMTEAARANNLETVWANIFARLSSAGRGPNGQGGLALFNSSFVGMNFFHTMYQWGQDPTMDDWESWKFDCYSSPYIQQKDIEIARRTLPDKLFRQNWLCEPIGSGGEVFTNVNEVSIGQPQEPEPGMRYFASWDPAQRGDNSPFLVRNEMGEQVFSINLTGRGWPDQENIVELHTRRYNNAHLYIDCTGIGDTIPAEMTMRGLDVEPIYWSGGGAVNVKEQLVAKFIVLMEQKAPVLLDDEIQKGELRAYSYKITKAGHFSYSAPQGMTDDYVSALIMLYKDFNSIVQVIPWMGMVAGIPHKKIV